MFTVVISPCMFAVTESGMAPKDPRIELSMVENVPEPISSPSGAPETTIHTQNSLGCSVVRKGYR